MTADLTMKAVHEWIGHDPFGKPKPMDVPAEPRSIVDAKGAVSLRAARNGYVSFRIVVEGAGEFAIAASVGGGLEADLFKAWYHRMPGAEGAPPTYWPDALVPVRRGKPIAIPDPDNQIDGQTAQEFWVDIFVPPDAKPGTASGRVTLKSAGETTTLPIRIEVLDRAVPDEPCIVMDHNSYGCRWLATMYPTAFARAKTRAAMWDKAIEILQHYFRIVHEHRGLLHNLGYGHSGACDPIYCPRAEGRGRDRRIVDWTLFDRHYAPLLDGSAFGTAAPGMPRPRRPATPISYVYTPINPDWPADYINWGERGYEVEFTRGLAQFDAHFRERGWTRTNVEFFFNHKKRTRWYEWDGDEVKYIRDMAFHKEMVRMWESVVLGSPVKWVYRMDASWQMKNMFDVMAGHRNFWVCAGFYRWYPDEVRRVMARGDLTWWYNGTPAVNAASSGILSNAYQTWVNGFHGNCAWLCVNPGPDPWFNCDGAATGSIYPGDRFGIPGPIPSIRLKVQRNGIQDIDLVNRGAEEAGNVAAVREEIARAIPIPLHSKPPKAALELPPEDWDSRNLSEGHEPEHVEQKTLDPFWFDEIRRRAMA